MTTLWARRSKDRIPREPSPAAALGDQPGERVLGPAAAEHRGPPGDRLRRLRPGRAGASESPRPSSWRRWNGRLRSFPRTSPAISWAWGMSRTSSKPSSGASTFSTASSRPGTPATARSSPAAGGLVIKNQKYARDPGPSTRAARCFTCRHFSRAYLRHLYEREEISSAVLNTIHNLHFYLDIFRKIRQSIALKFLSRV